MNATDIQKISDALKKYKMPPIYNEKGEPVYTLWFIGTEAEVKAVQAEIDVRDD